MQLRKTLKFRPRGRFAIQTVDPPPDYPGLTPDDRFIAVASGSVHPGRLHVIADASGDLRIRLIERYDAGTGADTVRILERLGEWSIRRAGSLKIVGIVIERVLPGYYPDDVFEEVTYEH